MLFCSNLTACSATKEERLDYTLEEIVEMVYGDIDTIPEYMITELNDEVLFESFAFIDYDEEYKAVSADAMVNVVPHSVVVIDVGDNDAEDVAKAVKEKANPNKWICVSAEDVQVAVNHQYVLLVMSDLATTSQMVENFTNIK